MARRKSTRDFEVKELLNMSPFKGDEDAYQQSAMDDFDKLIQYFMPEFWRKNLLGISNRPYLDGYLQDIADDSEENQAYYESLSLPYIVFGLSKLDNKKDTESLNGLRCEKVLKGMIHDSAVFNRHSGKLYQHHWCDRFYKMQAYIDDQKDTNYDQAIDDVCNQWKTAITDGLNDALGTDIINKLVKIVTECQTYAKANKCYWAFEVFRDLADPDSLSNWEFTITGSPNPVPEFAKDHLRYSSVMSMLDPAGFFTRKYAQITTLLILTKTLPFNMEASCGTDDYKEAIEYIGNHFAEIYNKSPDADLAKIAQIIKDNMIANGWKQYIDLFESVAAYSNKFQEFSQNLKPKFIEVYGPVGEEIANILLTASVAYTIGLFANGLKNPANDIMIAKCTRASAFFFKRGADILSDVTGYCETMYSIFHDTEYRLHESAQRVIACLGKFIVSYEHCYKADQSLYVVENLADSYLATAHSKFKLLGGNLSVYLAIRFACVTAVPEILCNSIATSNVNRIQKEIASKNLFLNSSVIDIVFAANSDFTTDELDATVEGRVIGLTSFAKMATLANGLAKAAVVAGLVVGKSQPGNPKDWYLSLFVNGSKVRDAGLFMPLKTDIDYFLVSTNEADFTLENGITIMASDLNKYLQVGSNGSLTLSSAVTMNRDTVLNISVNETGHVSIFTKVGNTEQNEKVLYLTAVDSTNVIMAAGYTATNKIDQQLWIAECIGNIETDEQNRLKSAFFTLRNAKYNKLGYLYVEDGKTIKIGRIPQEWKLGMEKIKPNKLIARNITLYTNNRGRRFFPRLLELGSSSGRAFRVDPDLPNFLDLDNEFGIISQNRETLVATPSKTYQMYAENEVEGSEVSASFNIEVIQAAD
jgi:hypothetical protein